jgi:UDP-N-acetylglucosamine 2-epimerase (non-hydrolysing)
MPEEINRMVTDAIVDVLWTPSSDADENLLNEGVGAEKIDMIGNIMIDSFEMLRDRIESAGAREAQGLEDGEYALVTLHRPSNVDAEETLAPIVSELVSSPNSYQPLRSSLSCSWLTRGQSRASNDSASRNGSKVQRA